VAHAPLLRPRDGDEIEQHQDRVIQNRRSHGLYRSLFAKNAVHGLRHVTPSID
jgi:hypothetical protein